MDCRTCGEPLQAPKTGRRLYCSDRCRKAQYGGTCIDCGARTYGGDGRANAPRRCLPCDLARGQDERCAKGDEWKARRERLAEMYLAGVPYKEMAAEMGWTVHTVTTQLIRMRRDYGYDLPHRYAMQDGKRIAA